MTEDKKMRTLKKILLITGSSLALIILPVQAGRFDLALTAQAHSGRTDASGGHHDYKNKSGLGSYHYHHGYPAHLHPDGFCPYDSAAADLDQGFLQPDLPVPAIVPSIPQISDDGQTAVGTDDQTVDAGNGQTGTGYESVIFDPAFYAATYADLAPIQGDAAALYAHFETTGMAEGRQGAATFNVTVYIQNNPDLVSLFGNDLKLYYGHYVNSGQYEGRVAY